MKGITDFGFIVKICGVTREVDALAAVEAGAHAIGFNFYRKSPRYVTPERAAEIVSRVPGDYLRVGVFVNASREELDAIAAAVPLDIVQLHGTATQVAQRAWRAIPASRIQADVEPGFEAYLLDTTTPRYGGSGETFDWHLAAGFRHRAILAGGLDASNVRHAISIARPCGVDACSRLESEPGKKDAISVREFVKAAREAARQMELEL